MILTNVEAKAVPIHKVDACARVSQFVNWKSEPTAMAIAPGVTAIAIATGAIFRIQELMQCSHNPNRADVDEPHSRAAANPPAVAE